MMMCMPGMPICCPIIQTVSLQFGITADSLPDVFILSMDLTGSILVEMTELNNRLPCKRCK